MYIALNSRFCDSQNCYDEIQCTPSLWDWFCLLSNHPKTIGSILRRGILWWNDGSWVLKSLENITCYSIPNSLLFRRDILQYFSYKRYHFAMNQLYNRERYSMVIQNWVHWTQWATRFTKKSRFSWSCIHLIKLIWNDFLKIQ